MFRYGSVCSGIESASVAWEPLGMSAAWFSEIEPFPCSVLAHHWPDVANLGDMTQLPSLVRMGLIEAPNVLVGGTPCQAFSVAGKRGSLDDDRGQLTLTYVDLLNAIDEQRVGDECVAVWENVPGVLNTKDNAFGCFLGELSGSGCELQPSGKKWGNAGCVFGPQRAIAWRIIDAQYFGVAQRRRRVFIVASARNGFDPTKILFESEGVRRCTPPIKDERGYRSTKIKGSFGSHGEAIGCLMARDYKGLGNQYLTEGKIIITDGKPRRPTPKEYEVLQGFPDGHTNVQHRGKPAADGPRYKAIGNSKAVPCIQWIGARLIAYQMGYL